jgi:hypothetical protein
MGNTTYFKKAGDMKQAPPPECHGAQGYLGRTVILSGSPIEGRRPRSFHDDILKPGVSIGVHKHELVLIRIPFFVE